MYWRRCCATASAAATHRAEVMHLRPRSNGAPSVWPAAGGRVSEQAAQPPIMEEYAMALHKVAEYAAEVPRR